MTNNVPKGAGRATATAKRNKHAQHTPLPPKPGVIEQARRDAEEIRVEAIVATLPAEIQDEARYGTMTVEQLRKIAGEMGIPGARSMRKGPLMSAILEWERAQTKTDERLAERDLTAEVFEVAEKSKPATAPPVIRPKAEPREEASDCSGDPNLTEAQLKSHAKAEAFLAAAAESGWAEKARSAPNQTTYGVIVGRGEERITISWDGGVFVGPECYHSHPARTPRKVINASAAKKIMAIPAAQADEEAKKVSAQKSARPRRDRAAGAATAGRKALPFDPETAEDEEVLRAVSGRSVSWTNEVSGAIDEEHVRGSVDEISIQKGKSGRSIRFTTANGFRSVRVSSIVAIR